MGSNRGTQYSLPCLQAPFEYYHSAALSSLHPGPEGLEADGMITVSEAYPPASLVFLAVQFVVNPRQWAQLQLSHWTNARRRHSQFLNGVKQAVSLWASLWKHRRLRCPCNFECGLLGRLKAPKRHPLAEVVHLGEEAAWKPPVRHLVHVGVGSRASDFGQLELQPFALSGMQRLLPRHGFALVRKRLLELLGELRYRK